MTDPQTTDFEKTKLEVARYELGYRRDKQWNIFSWIATILIAVISGVAALSNRFGDIDNIQKAAMSIGILIITIYSVVWIHSNMDAEIKSRNRIHTYFNEKEGGILGNPRSFWPGYNPTIIVLFFGAVTVIWEKDLVCLFSTICLRN